MKTFQGYISVSFEVEAEDQDEAWDKIAAFLHSDKEINIGIHDSDMWEDK